MSLGPEARFQERKKMTENMWNESIARGEMRNEATTIWFRILMVALHLCIGIPTVVNTLFNVITINMPSPQNFMAYSNTDIIDSRQVMKNNDSMETSPLLLGVIGVVRILLLQSAVVLPRKFG